MELRVQNEAGQRVTEFCQENTLVQQTPPSNNTSENSTHGHHQMSMENSTHGQYQNQIDYILRSQKWRSSIQSEKTRLGADCGSDHELLVAKFLLKLKKDVKTTTHSGTT